jgi:hypothetical protein
MLKSLREQKSRFRLDFFIMPGLAKAKAPYHPIWLVLRKEGEKKKDPGR